MFSKWDREVWSHLAVDNIDIKRQLLPEGYDEISPIFLQNFPKNFSQAKTIQTCI